GAEVDGRYCKKCGASLGAPTSSQVNILPDHAAAALSYVLGAITGVLFLTLEPYNRNPEVRFHAWQSVLFSLIVLAIIAAGPLSATVLPWALIAVVGFVELGLVFAMLAVWLALMYKAYVGERWVLPVIGPIALRKA
ncbi:MAG: hypothetical protein SFV51_13430, partial [Bryobacteraceae bacterium]|nr:hypothetical protein [Bryobacteraceae bacterium]